MEIGLHLEQTQKLIITPELRQAIEILQLSSMDLVDFTNQALMENPLLEAKESERNGERQDTDVYKRQDRIILLISHRLALFDQTDSVLFLGREKTVQSSHRELLKTCPEYAGLVRLQRDGAAGPKEGWS